MYFGSIGDPILASGANYNSGIYSNPLRLTYHYHNNSGNPASTAYLDYISLEAPRDFDLHRGAVNFL